MVATDGAGRQPGFLATEENFGGARTSRRKNLLVPVVGDFARAEGHSRGRRVRAGARRHVTAFYTSNVEQYLFRTDCWDDFCANVATLPLDATSTFIFSGRARRAAGSVAAVSGIRTWPGGLGISRTRPIAAGREELRGRR